MISHWIKSVKSQVLHYPYVPTNERSYNLCVQRINRETREEFKNNLRRLESITVIRSTWTCAYRNVNSNINVNEARITRSCPINALLHGFAPAILELYCFFPPLLILPMFVTKEWWRFGFLLIFFLSTF